MKPSERLEAMGLTLPTVAAPVAAYVPAMMSGTTIRTSGQLPFVSGELIATGKVGADVDEDTAVECAKACVLNALAAAADVAGGLDHILRIVHVTGYVASDPEFSSQPSIINGASNLLNDLFGERGVHTRSAVGVAVLPLNVPVELELTCEIAKPSGS